MRASIISVLTFALGAVAAPGLIKREDDDWCMTEEESKTVANNFATLIRGYTKERAERFLCTSFSDYSDSVNELINNGCTAGPVKLGDPTFSSRAQFEAGQGSQPNITFDILKTWNACDAVGIRWKTDAPGIPSVTDQQRVTGIIIAETVRATGPEPWLIETVYSEFNSGAWLYDLALTKPTNCSAVH